MPPKEFFVNELLQLELYSIFLPYFTISLFLPHHKDVPFHEEMRIIYENESKLNCLACLSIAIFFYFWQNKKKHNQERKHICRLIMFATQQKQKNIPTISTENEF